MNFEGDQHERVEEDTSWQKIIKLSEELVDQHGRLVSPEGTAKVNEAKFEAIYGSSDFLLTLRKISDIDVDGHQNTRYKLWAGLVSVIGEPSLSRYYQYDENGVILNDAEGELTEITGMSDGSAKVVEIDYFLNDAKENALPWVNPTALMA